MRTFPAFLFLVACNGAAPAPVEVPTPEPLPAPGSTAANVLAALDSTVDPCTDFYAYACGGWIKNTTLPPDKAITVRSFNTIQDENEILLKRILEEVAANPGTDPDRQKLGAFWTSCMNEAAIDAKGIGPISPTLAKIDALKDKKKLMALVGELNAQGYPALLGAWVDADPKNPRLAILQVAQGGTGLPDREYYLAEDKAEIRAQYQTHAEKLFALAGFSEADAKKAAADVLAFETKLAGVQWKQEQLRDATATYNKLDRAGLEKITPGLDWGAYLAAHGRSDLTQINVLTPSFFEGEAKLLAATPLPTLRTYLKWQVLNAASDNLADPFEQEAFQFYGRVLYGQQEQSERWKRCIEKTDGTVGDLLAKAYVAEAFPGESKPVAVDMISRIEGSFEEGLAGLAWMDDETRTRAVEKARAITNKIGYPNAWRTYGFEVTPDDFFGNVQRGTVADTQYWLEKAEKPIDPDTWFMTAPTVNAYYNPSQNEIVFPAGILQPPFFSIDYPKAMNFGAMGMVMGHELTHGFDDEGRKFDGQGLLTDWWATEAVERFETAAACVDSQYDAFEVQPGLHLNGELTLGENIADLGGSRTAYRAYRKWVAENGEETAVPGLTGDQLFFVALGQAWCSVASPEVQRVRAATDPHAAPRFRVNGPLVNLPEFAAAFQCEPGEPMHPTETCEVW